MRTKRYIPSATRRALANRAIGAAALLLFATIDGKPLSPIDVSGEWGRFAESIGMPEITFHALRHTHASQLIDAGVDVVTVSRRLGHATPNITLAVYAHLFQKDDGKAATAINVIFNR